MEENNRGEEVLSEFFTERGKGRTPAEYNGMGSGRDGVMSVKAIDIKREISSKLYL